VFGNNKKQYINILKQNKQLKLDYKTFQDKKIVKQEQSTFLITDENMPEDALFRLDTLQKNIPNTYLTSLFEGENQQIIPSSNVDVIGYEAVVLDNNYSVVIPKNEIVSASRYFTNSGIDYIISPMSLLYEYIQDQSVKNSLNVLIYNNVVYVIIVNNLKQITFSQIKELTAFDEIQDEEFSDDDIVGQKLYEEVHFLEIQQFLNDVVQEYYTQNEGVDFLEKVELLYSLKPLTDEQIESLYETIMVKINHKSIDIEEYIDNINLKDNSQKYSFTNERAKKQKSNMIVWILLAMLSIAAVATVLYYKIEDNKIEKSIEKNIQLAQKKEVNKLIKKEPITPLVKEELVVEKIIELPNHISQNNSTLQDIYMLFDVVPYDGILKDLEILKDGSTYVCNFIANTSSLEDMQAKLLNIYKESKILLKHQNKAVINSIIENNVILDKKTIMNHKEYKKEGFLSTSAGTEYLVTLLPTVSKVNYISKDKNEYLTYNFTIESLVKDPKDFFNFIEALNRQDLSITLNYPVTFAKVNNGLEVKYNIQLHQVNKKPVQPKK